MMMARRKRRKVGSWIGWFFAWLGGALVMFGLCDMLVTVLWKGATNFRWSMLTHVTTGIAGGFLNAILGTFLLIAVSIVFATPLGILGAVFVSEFANSKAAIVIRFLTEVLSGVPSIVIGYFGYLLMVLQWGWGFSPLAGGISLTIIMLPYILRTTESSLQQVPLAQREAAWALGMTRAQAISKILWRPVAGNIATGVLMAIAIGMGETAPLLYTAGWSSYNPSLQLVHQQVGYLTYVVWTYLDQPYPQAQALAYSAALVLVLIVLLIHVIVRVFIRRRAQA